MLQCTPDGVPFVKDPLISAAIKVPHKREVLKAIKQIGKATKDPEVIEPLEKICHFLGVTLEHVTNGG